METMLLWVCSNREQRVGAGWVGDGTNVWHLAHVFMLSE